MGSRGRLLSFEGLDGAGKTTQIDLLVNWLQTRGVPYLHTREPGGSPLGNELRHLLLARPDLEITPLAEAFLFQADRAQHFASVVLPALANGTLVVTDRCLDSSIAYQGMARGIGMEPVERLSLWATQGHVPDLTIFLDIDPSLVQERTDITRDQSGLRETLTHFDQAAEPFQQKLRQAYLMQAAAHPQRFRVIDATQTPQEVHKAIIALVETLLHESIL